MIVTVDGFVIGLGVKGISLKPLCKPEGPYDGPVVSEDGQSVTIMKMSNESVIRFQRGKENNDKAYVRVSMIQPGAPMPPEQASNLFNEVFNDLTVAGLV